MEGSNGPSKPNLLKPRKVEERAPPWVEVTGPKADPVDEGPLEKGGSKSRFHRVKYRIGAGGARGG